MSGQHRPTLRHGATAAPAGPSPVNYSGVPDAEIVLAILMLDVLVNLSYTGRHGEKQQGRRPGDEKGADSVQEVRAFAPVAGGADGLYAGDGAPIGLAIHADLRSAYFPLAAVRQGGRNRCERIALSARRFKDRAMTENRLPESLKELTAEFWRRAWDRARKTAKWSVTMTQLVITKLNRRWKLVTFAGKKGGEWIGVVDILAVRKCGEEGCDGLKRGDLLEMILIQVKGGSAAWPTDDDVVRLRLVGKHHRAKYVLLAEWKKGKLPTFHKLKASGSGKDAWEVVVDPLEIFR
jgi:hypothetical protein